GLLPIDTRFAERTVEQLSCWSHEWFAGLVLLVARLFADEHDARRSSPFPEHGLRRVRIERTTAATLHGICERGERRAVGKKGFRVHRASQPAAGADAGSAIEPVRRSFFNKMA